MCTAQIYPIRVNDKQIHTTYTYIHTNMRKKKMFVGPEILESCHEILHALINKPIDFKLSSAVEVSKTYEMIFTEHSTIVILAIENLQKLIPGPSCSKHRFVSVTSSLRGQLVKCFTTSSSNTLKFFVEKMREALAIFRQKILAYLRH